jgi:hypothetical protein
LDIRLDNPKLNSDPNMHNQCEHIRSVALTNGAFHKGTSTRIVDHRLALVATEDIEVCDPACVGSMEFLDRIPPLEEEGYTAILWHGGSNCNRQSDLVYNAKRAIDMVHYNGPKTKSELALALSPSGKHEAFCLLIDNMVKIGLFIPTPQSGLLELPSDLGRNDPCSDLRMTELRRLYSAPSSEVQLKLLEEFTDLHPFRIDFRLKWFANKG